MSDDLENMYSLYDDADQTSETIDYHSTDSVFFTHPIIFCTGVCTISLTIIVIVILNV